MPNSSSLRHGLIFHWQPGPRSASVAVDRLANARGVLQSAATPYPCKYGMGIDIPGSAATTENAIRFPTTGLTQNPLVFAVWCLFMPDNKAGAFSQPIFTKHAGSTGLNGWAMNLNAGVIDCRVGDAVSRDIANVTLGGSNGDLNQIGMTFDGATIRTYLNGQANTTTVCTRTITATAQALMIGNNDRTATTTQGSLDGKIFAAAMWSYPIGSKGFASLFQNPLLLIPTMKRRSYKAAAAAAGTTNNLMLLGVG